MRKKIIILFTILISLIFLVSCIENPTGSVVGGCPQYQCVKTAIEAPYNSEAIELSGKGPTIFSGTVHPKVRIINPNDEPVRFQVIFLCENLYKSTTKTIKTGEVWLQPKGSTIVQGDFKVGAKENWECSYQVSASSINSCQLRQV